MTKIIWFCKAIAGPATYGCADDGAGAKGALA
jgi:hypothetical protein